MPAGRDISPASPFVPVTRPIGRKVRQPYQQLLEGGFFLQQSENISDQMGRVANCKLLWTGESFVGTVSND